ncbi:MAG: poly-beta-1,6-N-acetyl-D-glucosamine N-deacetylase PgaB [Pseudomonadales bacterium]
MNLRAGIAAALLAALTWSGWAAAAPAQTAEPPLLALSYHDVVPALTADADATTITVNELVRHFTWLAAEGYQPITLDDWLNADRGRLPEKPVLLTFDDGYASFHDHVLPLLRLFGFPAVLAPVTSWIEMPAHSQVPYGSLLMPRDHFLTWAELREAAASGLVEIATHSHDLHRGVLGNPFGNEQPAATTRRYDSDRGSYEDEAAYRARVRADLARSVALIEEHVGVTPRTVVWPYGAYNATTLTIARALGLERAITLDPVTNVAAPGGPSPVVHRHLIGTETDLPAFAMLVRGLYADVPMRAAHVDLDYVYDADPAQQARNLDVLLDRVKAMGINRVLLQAFADPDGDGVADAVYFRNRHLPTRADLFNRVAWQLRTRAGVEVFAWMPVLAFELPDAARNEALAVRAADDSHHHQYHRLSPFHPDARRLILEIYDDLGAAAHFRGVLFHDDALLGDREDVSEAALAHYAEAWGARVAIDPSRAAGLRLDGMTEAEFARAKTRHLIDFTLDLAAVLRRHQPMLETARNLYARPVLDPASEAWFAQDLAEFLQHYDYTALMAMPHLEGADQPLRWLKTLVRRVAEYPGGLERTLFELQTVDWRSGRPLPAAEFARKAETLLNAGARHVAWYPDDFVAGNPPLPVIRSILSLADHPAVGR